ncbi:MAG TPA: transporter substrate-binding domain-containing protein [Steroidobacteraceae bacterium]|nr:transporter substrate-binding domain-containing protein [Steroidobacteraceae bacterium]
MQSRAESAARGIRRPRSCWLLCALLWTAAGHAHELPEAAASQPGPTRFVTEEEAVGRLFDLLQQRLAVMPAVAAAKWQTKAPIFDQPRETAVIQRAQALGELMGLTKESVGHLFELQALLAREVQSGLHEQWSDRGFDYSGPVPGLADLRPRLDALTEGLLRALHVAAPSLRRPEWASRWRSLALGRLQGPPWTDGSRQELLAILGGLRQEPVSASQRVLASGILRIGTTGDYAPFSLEKDGVLDGSDVELAEELARDLHARAVFVRTSWATMLEDLQADRFDLAMGGVSITPARQAAASFSESYQYGGKTILARCADAPKYPDLGAVDRPDVRVIVNPGGTNEQFIHGNVHRARIVTYPDNRGIFDELVAGHADVMITDDVEVELQTRRHKELCRSFPGTLTHADKAALLPRDSTLVPVTNAWLHSAQAEGEPARLLNQFLNR